MNSTACALQNAWHSLFGMWALGTSFQFCQVWVFLIVIPRYCLRFLTFNESETHGCQWLQCIVWFCFGFFILYINQICQTSVLLILVTKRGLSNVKISRETSIVNASVAGREKHVKKVIGFHYLSYLEQSCIGFCYILQWSLILCSTIQKSELNLDYTPLVVLPFCELVMSTLLSDFNVSQLGLGKII